jgi:hypothetical protein
MADGLPVLRSGGALERVGWHMVEVSPALVRLPNGGAMTLNGIAQGFITDKVVALLKSFGLEHALVNVGAIRAVGRPAGFEAWPVHLDAAGTSRKTVGLKDGSVATSRCAGNNSGCFWVCQPHRGSAQWKARTGPMAQNERDASFRGTG